MEFWKVVKMGIYYWWNLSTTTVIIRAQEYHLTKICMEVNVDLRYAEKKLVNEKVRSRTGPAD